MNQLKIYTLEENNQIIYVGKTADKLRTRFLDHKRKKFKGRNIKLELIEELENISSNGWQEYQYIEQFKAWGFPLENIILNGDLHAIRTDGTKGTKEYRRAWEQNHRKKNLKKYLEVESSKREKNREKINASRVSRHAKNPEHERKIQRDKYNERLLNWNEEDQLIRDNKNKKLRIKYKLNN